MFSGFIPSSVPRFGFGRSAGSATPINIPPVEVHDVETTTEKRGRRLKHLLKLNHVNFSILYNHLRYHNHTPHLLGSAYLFGASADHLTEIYEDAAANEGHEHWKDSPGEISLHDWRDFLSKREYQRAYVDFFEDQLVLHGYDWKNVIEEFMLKGKEPLINNLISGLGHPLIHLGYAYEISSREVAMEALGLAATCYNDWHKYLDDEKYSKMPTDYATSNLFEILARINMDKRFDGVFDSIGGNNLSKLFDEYEDLLLSYWNSWKILDPVKQFEQSQKAAVATLISTAPSVGGHGYDFFFVHLLTTSHAVRILIPFLPAKFHIPLVRQWWLITCAMYISQLRPVIKADQVLDYDLKGRGWEYAEEKAIKGKYALHAHYVKAIRAMKEAGKVWGDKDEFYLKAACKFAEEFGSWGGFSAEDETENEIQREKKD